MSVRLESVSKIFGSRPEKAADLLAQGASKADIRARTGQTVALKDITLEIPEARTSVIMGLSGSGKSTLLRIINRLIEPTSGTVTLDGEDILTLSPSALTAMRRERMAMVFQHFALLPHRSVIDNIAYGLEIRGLKKSDRRERARRWLEAVGLAGYEQAAPRELSGGMRQRVGLARGLATDADILLMDEPFSALDPLIRREMQDLLLGLQKDLRKTIIFITHDLDEALTLGDQISIMQDGEIIQTGGPGNIILHPETEYVRAFAQDANRGRVLQARQIMRDADLTVQDTDRPFSALRQCKEKDQAFAVVVDSRGWPRGLVTLDTARDGASGPSGTVGGLMDSITVVAPETALEQILPALLQSPYPVAVAETGLSGPQGPLLGIIDRDDVLAALAGVPL